jgi:hypothetical protein
MGLDHGQESWAVIKLYYSLFYFLRSKLADSDCAIIRCNGIYTLDLKLGASPKKRNYPGDHKATIAIFTERFADQDILLSQKIEEKNAYDWMCDKREWINYRRRKFFDATGEPGFCSDYATYPEQIVSYLSDQIPIICFDPDYATLALPVKCAQLAIFSKANGRALLDECVAQYDGSLASSPCCRAFLTGLEI